MPVTSAPAGNLRVETNKILDVSHGGIYTMNTNGEEESGDDKRSPKPTSFMQSTTFGSWFGVTTAQAVGPLLKNNCAQR